MELAHGKTLSCHHTNSIAGEDYRHEHMSFHYMRRTLDLPPPWTQSLGGPFVEYKGCHSSEPLFTTIQWNVCNPGQRYPTIPMPPNLPRSHTAPRLTLRHKVESEIYTKADLIRTMQTTQIMHDLVILPMPYMHNTFSHLLQPNADCRFLLIPVGGIGSTCSFLQRSCLTLASMSTKDSINLSHSLKFNATPLFVGYQRSSPETLK